MAVGQRTLKLTSDHIHTVHLSPRPRSQANTREVILPLRRRVPVPMVLIVACLEKNTGTQALSQELQAPNCQIGLWFIEVRGKKEVRRTRSQDEMATMRVQLSTPTPPRSRGVVGGRLCGEAFVIHELWARAMPMDLLNERTGKLSKGIVSEKPSTGNQY